MSKHPVEARGHTREQTVEQKSEAGAAAEVLPVVAANLRRIRQEKGLSLAELAALSKLSPALLDALSAGQEEPNIKTLWSLANALGVPFRALIANQPAAADNEATDAPSTRAKTVPKVSSRKVLASHDDGRNSEVYEVKLAPKALEWAAPRPAGAIENVLVSQGSAEVRTGTLHYTLNEGESVSFRADQRRHYQSLGDAPATLYIVISQPVE